MCVCVYVYVYTYMIAHPRLGAGRSKCLMVEVDLWIRLTNPKP